MAIIPNQGTDPRLVGDEDLGAFTGSSTGSLGEKLKYLEDILSGESFDSSFVESSPEGNLLSMVKDVRNSSNPLLPVCSLLGIPVPSPTEPYNRSLASYPFQAEGSINGATTGTANVAWPTHQKQDIGFLLVETRGDQDIDSDPTSVGWTLISNQAAGGADALSTRLRVYYQVSTSSSMPSTGLTGATTDHKIGRIVTLRGRHPDEDPLLVRDVATGTKVSLGTSFSFPSVEAKKGDTIIFAASDGTDSSAAWFSSISNSNLADITEHSDGGNVSGDGGRFAFYSARSLVDGPIGTSTATISNLTFQSFMVASIKRKEYKDIYFPVSQEMASSTQVIRARKLTLDAGATLTFNRNPVILVVDTLTLGAGSPATISVNGPTPTSDAVPTNGALYAAGGMVSSTAIAHGGYGGGSILIIANRILNQGNITANGGNGFRNTSNGGTTASRGGQGVYSTTINNSGSSESLFSLPYTAQLGDGSGLGGTGGGSGGGSSNALSGGGGSGIGGGGKGGTSTSLEGSTSPAGLPMLLDFIKSGIKGGGGGGAMINTTGTSNSAGGGGGGLAIVLASEIDNISLLNLSATGGTLIGGNSSDGRAGVTYLEAFTPNDL